MNSRPVLCPFSRVAIEHTLDAIASYEGACGFRASPLSWQSAFAAARSLSGRRQRQRTRRCGDPMKKTNLAELVYLRIFQVGQVGRFPDGQGEQTLDYCLHRQAIRPVVLGPAFQALDRARDCYVRSMNYWSSPLLFRTTRSPSYGWPEQVQISWPRCDYVWIA